MGEHTTSKPEGSGAARVTAAWVVGLDGTGTTWKALAEREGGTLLRALCARHTRILSSEALPAEGVLVEAVVEPSPPTVAEALREGGEVLLLGATLIGLALDEGWVDALRVVLCSPAIPSVHGSEPVLGAGVHEMGRAWRARQSSFERLAGFWVLEASR